MTLRVAVAQINAVVGDISGNSQLILDAWKAASDVGAHVVLFPELAVTGYPPEDLLLKPEFVDANLAAVERLAALGLHGTVAIVGFVDSDLAEDGAREEWDVTIPGRHLRNAAAAISDGRVVGTYGKWRLPNYGVFDEARYFVADDESLVVDVAGVPVGVTVCEDLWVDEGPVARAVDDGAVVIANINASPYHRGKRAERERWVADHARRHGVHVAYANMVGGQDEVVFDGDSMIAGPDGAVMARGAQFATDLVVVDLPVGEREVAEALAPRHEQPRLSAVAEVWEALVLGVTDYCHKNGFRQAVIGLSGGIDSAVTAAIAVDALGADNVWGVAMPSPYSSSHSVEDAEALAANLDMRFSQIPISDAMKAFDGMLADVFAETEAGVTEENIQARIRGVVLMALSNKFGRILLTTGNKSEMAVGYATLYGDMAGGFAMLKDVPKLLVYELARHANRDRERVPERTITKPPSAELRPGQMDQDSLPPYEVLDQIVEAYVEDDLGIEAIVAQGHPPALVDRIVRLIDRAEYKRRQAPPGVKITDRAFGKDRRVPITNGWDGRAT